ncbi:MAG: hypothetical protein ACLTBV_19915 [Enterocloster bolteae]
MWRRKNRRERNGDYKKEKKAFKMPHGYVDYFCYFAICFVYDVSNPSRRISARDKCGWTGKVVIPDSFGFIDKTPVPFWEIPNYIMKSFTKQADIIFGILIVGAGLEVLLSTGMFHAFCNRLSKACSGKENGLFLYSCFFLLALESHSPQTSLLVLHHSVLCWRPRSDMTQLWAWRL